MHTLPPEVLTSIVGFLDARSLGRVSTLSTLFRGVTHGNAGVWRALVACEYGWLLPAVMTGVKPDGTWKDLCVKCVTASGSFMVCGGALVHICARPLAVSEEHTIICASRNVLARFKPAG